MKKVISKIKSGEAAGPSGIVIEMTSNETCIDLVIDLANSIVMSVWFLMTGWSVLSIGD